MTARAESPLELLAQLTQENEALRSASRRKDQFLAMVAHELRTPLNAILGWVEMLESGDLPPEEHLTAFRTIRRNARIQVQLSEDLLDIARIVGGKLRLDRRPGPLGPIVQAAIDAARPIAEAKGVVLVPALADTATPILADPERLQQVVGNLIGNAVKFTPARGKVTVSTRRVDGGVELVVADEGEGIEASFLPQVFDRFLQAEAEGSRRGGLGLGLAIVKYITEMHDGTVGAASAGLGLGAQFSLFLPGFTMERAETRVLAASSAVEALELLQRERPDVIVSDIGMPEIDGFEFLRQVRSRPRADGRFTPAIALTAYARFEDRAKAFLAGFQAHLPKPVHPAELLALIASLAGRVQRSEL